LRERVWRHCAWHHGAVDDEVWRDQRSLLLRRTAVTYDCRQGVIRRMSEVGHGKESMRLRHRPRDGDIRRLPSNRLVWVRDSSGMIYRLMVMR
jgi:hypothetical protein